MIFLPCRKISVYDYFNKMKVNSISLIEQSYIMLRTLKKAMYYDSHSMDNGNT